jgi:hypothetical protein
VDALILAPGASPASVKPDGVALPPPTPPIRCTPTVAGDRADKGESDVLLEAGQIEPGDFDGDPEGGPAQQMETR